MICPNCGKPSELYDGLCKYCYINRNPLIREFERLDISICRKCSKVMVDNKSTKTTPKDALGKLLMRTIKPNRNFLMSEVCLDSPLDTHVSDQELDVTLKGKVNSQDITHKIKVPVKVISHICNKCQMPHLDYFEGIIQIRNVAEDEKDEIAELAQEESKREEKRHVYVTKIEVMKGGIDLFLTSQKHLQGVAKRLHKHFGGTLKIDEKLFTRDWTTSKDVFRVNATLLLPEYRVGDIISTNDRLMRINSIKGHILKGKDLMRNENFSIHTKQGVVLVTRKRSIIETRITKIYPVIEILNPDTYESSKIENKTKVKIGEKVKVVNHKGKFFIVL